MITCIECQNSIWGLCDACADLIREQSASILNAPVAPLPERAWQEVKAALEWEPEEHDPVLCD